MSGRVVMPLPARDRKSIDLSWVDPRPTPQLADETRAVARLIARRFGDSDDARLVLDALGVSA